MFVKEIEKLYVSKHGGFKEAQSLTDVIPKGITILYGRSGAGKTYSLIKHLTSNGITPCLIDFDNNPKLDFEYSQIGGKFFVDTYDSYSDVDIHKKMLFKFIEPYKEVEHFQEEKERELSEEQLKEFHTLMDNYYGAEGTFKELFNGLVFIIDTYAYATSIVEPEKLHKMIDTMKENGADVIIIGHATGERDKYVDVDEKFANHCDGKLKLTRDITKTKQDTFLTIEKKRGHQGDSIIWDWEREND